MIYKPDAVECKSCPFASSCGPIATERLARVRAELGIVERPKKIAAEPAPTAGPTKEVFDLPKKVAALIARLERAGIRVTESLSRGENPFKGFPFLQIVAALLLHPNYQRGVSRDLLEMAMQRGLKCPKGAAEDYANQAIHALTSIGAISVQNNMLTLRRTHAQT